MRFKNSLMAVLVALPFAIACGSDCYDLCDDWQDEACNDFDHGDCVHRCVDQEDFFDETDKCESDYDKVLECVTDLDDVCDSLLDPDKPDEEPECLDEFVDYYDCVQDYCDDHPNKDWCKATTL